MHLSGRKKLFFFELRKAQLSIFYHRGAISVFLRSPISAILHRIMPEHLHIGVVDYRHAPNPGTDRDSGVRVFPGPELPGFGRSWVRSFSVLGIPGLFILIAAVEVSNY